MNETTKNNLTEQATWKRIAYMILFVITFNVAEFVLAIIVVLQIIFKLISGKPLDSLVDLGGEVGAYLREVSLFLTFASEDMPYPLGRWPGGNRDENRPLTPAES